MKQNEIEIGKLYKLDQFPKALYVGAKFPDGLGLVVIDGNDSLGNRVQIDSFLLSGMKPVETKDENPRENYELDDIVEDAAERVHLQAPLQSDRVAIAKTLRPFFEIAVADQQVKVVSLTRALQGKESVREELKQAKVDRDYYKNRLQTQDALVAKLDMRIANARGALAP